MRFNDLKTHLKDQVLALVCKLVNGLQLLRKTLGDSMINYKAYRGYELFIEDHLPLFENCILKKKLLKLLRPIFK